MHPLVQQNKEILSYSSSARGVFHQPHVRYHHSGRAAKLADEDQARTVFGEKSVARCRNGEFSGFEGYSISLFERSGVGVVGIMEES